MDLTKVLEATISPGEATFSVCIKLSYSASATLSGQASFLFSTC